MATQSGAVQAMEVPPTAFDEINVKELTKQLLRASSVGAFGGRGGASAMGRAHVNCVPGSPMRLRGDAPTACQAQHAASRRLRP